MILGSDDRSVDGVFLVRTVLLSAMSDRPTRALRQETMLRNYELVSWVEAVNHHAGFGGWTFSECRNSQALPRIFEKLKQHPEKFVISGPSLSVLLSTEWVPVS